MKDRILNLYCADNELYELLCIANVGQNISLNLIDAPKQSEYNHVDYILKCSSVMEEYDPFDSVFCFRYYNLATTEVQFDELTSNGIVEYYEILVFVVYGKHEVTVGTRNISCRFDAGITYEVLDFDTFCYVDIDDPEAISKYTYDRFIYHEPTYKIPNQLLTYMA